jgi:hypothetical protein
MGKNGTQTMVETNFLQTKSQTSKNNQFQ